MLIRIVGCAYGIQLLFVMPWFLGAIYRHEQPMWVWQAFMTGLEKHGVGDAILAVYLYLLFYSGIFVLPLLAITLWCAIQAHSFENYPSKESLMTAAWIGSTFLLFPESVIQFVRHLPWGGVGEWLIILWAAGGLLVAYAASQLRRKPIERG